MSQPVETKAVSVLQPALKGISTSKAAQIEAVFVPMVAKLKEFEADHASILLDADKKITEDVVIRAKTLRLAIAKVRIETEKMRKTEKEEYLRAGKAIDGVANILKFAVSDKEKQLDEIENHYKNLEIERLKDLGASRSATIELYGIDMDHNALADMNDDVWNNFYNGARVAHEQKIEALEKAEADQIAAEKAKAIEDERIRKENEELKQQQAEQRRLDDERIAKEINDKRKRDAELDAERAIVKAKFDAAQAEAENQRKQDQQKLDDSRKEIEAAKLAAQAMLDKKAEEEKAAQVKRDAELQAVREASQAKLAAAEILALKEREAAEKKQLELQEEMNRERIKNNKIRDEAIAKENLEKEKAKALSKASDDEKLAAFKEQVLTLYKNIPKLKNNNRFLNLQEAVTTVGKLCT